MQIDQQIDATARDLTGQKLILGGYYSSSFTYKGILSSVKLVFGGAEYGLYKLSEGNGLTWFNTAANRPANSDASILLNGSADGTQWTTSDAARPDNLLDGYYLSGSTYIPADPSNAGFDVLGNALGVPGSSTAIYPSENTFDRNFADAPELVAAGISQNEDLSYLDFTADSSRFYRDNTTYIDELLSYSDVPEPFIPAEMDASTFEKYTSVRNYLDQ